MESFDCVYICKQLAKSTSLKVRVYEGTNLLSSYSIWNISPDPVTPYLNEALNPKASCGVITTPLFQLYSFFTIYNRYRFIIGPSGLASNDEREIDKMLLELNIPKAMQKNYVHLLHCPPTHTLEKSTSHIKMLIYMADKIKPSTEDIFMNKKSTEQYSQLASNNMETSLKLGNGEDTHDNVAKAYSFEMMLWSLVREGQAEKIKEIYNSLPGFKAGEMARDSIRQIRNESICIAAMSSRSAIEGGLDCSTSFQISDLFIQKIELMHDYHSIRRLQWDLLFDYASRVRALHHGLEHSTALFERCAKYVQRNIAKHITVEEMAVQLNISRAYLCSCFKKEASVTLTQYIQKEKVMEAKRLLNHTKHSILEISNHLAFSSQSHFQTVFKKVSGLTPSQYRKENDYAQVT